MLYKMFPRCARGLYHLKENGGHDLAKNADFQKRTLSLVGYFIKNISAMLARPLYHLMEKGGDDLAKSADCQRRTLSLVCHVIKCFRAACARGLYHLIEKWRDDLAKIGDFSKQKIEFGLPCYRKLFQHKLWGRCS